MDKKEINWHYYVLQNVKFKGSKKQFEEELKELKIHCFGSRKSQKGFLFGIRVMEKIDEKELQESLTVKWSNDGYTFKIEEGNLNRYQKIGDSWPENSAEQHLPIKSLLDESFPANFLTSPSLPLPVSMLKNCLPSALPVFLPSSIKSSSSNLSEAQMAFVQHHLLSIDDSPLLYKAQTELKVALSKLDDAEQKYANEIILHADDIKRMSRLKEEMASMRQQFDKLKSTRHAAEGKLDSGKKIWLQQEENLQKEKFELEQRLADMDKQNAVLHDQIQALSTKLAMNVPQSMDEMRVEIAEDAKFDNLKSENSRLKSELQIIQKKLEETQTLHVNRPDEPPTSLELLRKVEILNAITDSNRFLREDRDALVIRNTALEERVTKVKDELVHLQEKNRKLGSKNEILKTENSSLRTEASRWRQRDKTLIERSSKFSMMASTHVYGKAGSAALAQASRRPTGSHVERKGMVESALNPKKLNDMDSKRYEQKSHLQKEDLSDILHEHDLKTSKRKRQQTSEPQKPNPKEEYKKFKF